MKKIVLILMIFICLILPVFSEEDSSVFTLYNEALGFQAGMLSGFGLSYYIDLEDGPALQFAGGAYYDSDLFYGLLDYNVGAEIHFPVYKEDFNRWLAGQLYIFTGLNHVGFIEEDGDGSFGDFNAEFTSGFGIGIEIILFRHFSMPLEIGYIGTWMPMAGGLSDQFSLGLQPQGGFRYRY